MRLLKLLFVLPVASKNLMQASGHVSDCLVSQPLERTVDVDVVTVLTCQFLSVPEQTAYPRPDRVYATSPLLVPRTSSTLLNWRNAINCCVLKHLLVLAFFTQDHTTARTAANIALHDWKRWKLRAHAPPGSLSLRLPFLAMAS